MSRCRRPSSAKRRSSRRLSAGKRGTAGWRRLLATSRGQGPTGGMTMTDKPTTTYQDRLRSILQPDKQAGDAAKYEMDANDLEAPPGAPFGYLRGIEDKAEAVELRFRDGTSRWFPYRWLGPWHYDPSEGLLLKFSGDIVYL